MEKLNTYIPQEGDMFNAFWRNNNHKSEQGPFKCMHFAECSRIVYALTNKGWSTEFPLKDWFFNKAETNEPASLFEI